MATTRVPRQVEEIDVHALNNFTPLTDEEIQAIVHFYVKLSWGQNKYPHLRAICEWTDLAQEVLLKIYRQRHDNNLAGTTAFIDKYTPGGKASKKSYVFKIVSTTLVDMASRTKQYQDCKNTISTEIQVEDSDGNGESSMLDMLEDQAPDYNPVSQLMHSSKSGLLDTINLYAKRLSFTHIPKVSYSYPDTERKDISLPYVYSPLLRREVSFSEETIFTHLFCGWDTIKLAELFADAMKPVGEDHRKIMVSAIRKRINALQGSIRKKLAGDFEVRTVNRKTYREVIYVNGIPLVDFKEEDIKVKRSDKVERIWEPIPGKSFEETLYAFRGLDRIEEVLQNERAAATLRAEEERVEREENKRLSMIIGMELDSFLSNLIPAGNRSLATA